MNGSQKISEPWGASVFGAASVNAAPDVVRLRLMCKQNAATPAEAFAVTRAAVTAIREALRAHGVADRQVSASRLGLVSATKYVNGAQRPNGYDCTVSFIIELRELDNMEPVLVDVVGAGINHVADVEFDVSTKRELRAEARRKAVAAAYEKAALYAEAANVALGSVVHIEDVDAESMQPVYRSHSSYAGGLSADGATDLVPGRVTVNAAVLLGFALKTPNES